MKFLSIIATLSAATLASAAAVPEPLEQRAELTARVTQNPGFVPFPFDESQADAIIPFFSLIENIPDSVLDQGEDAVHEYIIHGGSLAQGAPVPAPPAAATTVKPSVPATTLVTSVKLMARQSWISITNCALQLGLFLASNLLPGGKILKLRSLIKAAGGAREVAKALLKARSWADLAAHGEAIQEIADILFGFSDVAKACSSFL